MSVIIITQHLSEPVMVKNAYPLLHNSDVHVILIHSVK